MFIPEEAYRDHAQMVYRYLMAQCHDASLAEELTQETFYQAVRHAGRFDGSCRVTTWLCAIAKNQLAAYRRRHPATEELPDDVTLQALMGQAPSNEERAIGSQERIDLLKAMRQLGEEAREVVYLRVYAELTFAEIGEVLSRTENWARVTFYRAKMRLRTILEDGPNSRTEER